MKVINISLDTKILEPNSDVGRRVLNYANLVDKYFVIVIGRRGELNLSNKFKVKGFKSNNKIFTFFEVYKYLNNILKDHQYNVITVQDPYYLSFLAGLLAVKFNLKLEVQVHGFEKLSTFRRILAKNNLQKADSIRVVSQRLKTQLIRNFKVNEKKIYVVPIAIDKDRILCRRYQVNLKEKYADSFVFLTVSRLVKVKNIAMQIRALALLDNKKAQLVIVGDGPERKDLEKLTSSLGLNDRVHFVGWVDDLSDYYHSADCLLLSSDSEGYGAVIAEAVLVGLPVVMTEVGVAGDLVQDNVNGLIVPVGNERSFAQAMARMLGDRGLLQKFRENMKLFYDKILNPSVLIKIIVDKWNTL